MVRQTSAWPPVNGDDGACGWTPLAPSSFSSSFVSVTHHPHRHDPSNAYAEAHYPHPSSQPHPTCQ
eukprot:25023-Eustigmatos_ZCMA.PRE.1